MELPHSLGLLYEAVTDYLGFLHSSDEYKVMALASFGKPAYVDQFREIVQYRHDGSYTVDAPRLVERFGPRARTRRRRSSSITSTSRIRCKPCSKKPRSNSLSGCIEKTGLRETRDGGRRRAQLRDERAPARRGPFDEVWVQPAAGDAGTALGAALWIDYQRTRERGDCGAPVDDGPRVSRPRIRRRRNRSSSCDGRARRIAGSRISPEKRRRFSRSNA